MCDVFSFFLRVCSLLNEKKQFLLEARVARKKRLLLLQKKSGFFAPASSYILTRVRLALSHLKFFAEKRDGRRFVIIWCGTSLFTEPCVWSTVCFELLISIKLEFFKYFEFTVISSIERVFVLLLLRREEPRTQFYASSSTCRLSSYVAISDL